MQTIYIPTATLDSVIGHALAPLGQTTRRYLTRLAEFSAARRDNEDDATALASHLFSIDFPNLAGGELDGLLRCMVRRNYR